MKHKLIILFVLCTFFVISLMTNSMGPIFPALIDSYAIGLTLAGLFPFAFFIAYGVTSIPAGILVDKYGEKRVIILAFSLAFIGAVTFVCLPTFSIAMFSLFCIGTGMSLLQVAVNPLLRQAAGPEHFAFFSVLAQLAFGGAATLAPLVYQHFVALDQASAASANYVQQLLPENMSWLAMYWLLAVVALSMVLFASLVKMPKVNKLADESAGALETHLRLFKDKTVLKFFFAIAAYVALEQGLANSISVFLSQYHGLDTLSVGANVVSDFWFYMTLGCLLGLLLLKLIDSQILLLSFSLSSLVCFLVAIWGPSQLALICFPLVGFFISIMWSVIFSLALNSRAQDHGSFAGILCTGIIGGAFISPIIGVISELSGELRFGMLVLLIPMAYIGYVALTARPLIKNTTLFSTKAASKNDGSKQMATTNTRGNKLL
ncbi:MFS transporter [Shewanella baltica]|uniref:MFS transporter n=1 Tax=Shewanella baltica TaxID=62322 RepID=UPI003218B93E